MMHHTKKTLLAAGISLVVVIASFVGGIYVGHQDRPDIEKITELLHKESDVLAKNPEIDFDPFWKAWVVLNTKFVGDDSTTTEQKKVWGAIQGLVGSYGDPYTVFMPPEEAAVFAQNISGNFGGIGIEIGIRDNILTVIAPLKGTPAFVAGMLSGDKIVKIEATSTEGMSVDEAVHFIRGEIGTPVALTVVREGEDEPLDFKLTRSTINIPTIDTEKRDDGVFVIKLYNFSGTSAGLFRDALREFAESGYYRLVLDLRGNPGGFLEAAVDMASWFLPSGKVIVTEDYGGKRENIIHRSRGYDAFSKRLKMMILVNQGSASASEILAGALSEQGIAQLIGDRTFGKGSVQELEKLTPDSSLKITVAHWKTPLGHSISKGGLTPDYKVEITKADREAEKDPQLDKAIEILLSYPNS